MPITVEHGPNQSRYASVIAQSAKQTENYERMKQIAEFMQNVKQQNREYELGKKQNELTGRGQDIQYDLGLKDVGLQQQRIEQAAQQMANDLFLGKENVRIQDETLSQRDRQMANDMAKALLDSYMQNPMKAMNATGTNPTSRDSYYQASSPGFLEQANVSSMFG